MTLKEVKELYTSLEKRITNLQVQITNHCGQHTWDRIAAYAQIILMIIVIFLLKFKIL